MLNFFLAKLNAFDPDVLVGHQLEGVDFSILLNRLQTKKLSHWSRIGRMRRTDWPSSMGKMGGNFFAERSIISGRLLCDLANDAGKSTMTKCTSWSLTEMCSLYLSGASRLEVDNEDRIEDLGNHEGRVNELSEPLRSRHVLYCGPGSQGTNVAPYESFDQSCRKLLGEDVDGNSCRA